MAGKEEATDTGFTRQRELRPNFWPPVRREMDQYTATTWGGRSGGGSAAGGGVRHRSRLARSGQRTQ
jgi:hypothetical protein